MIELRALTEDDIEAHNAGEDTETIRWLSGGVGTEESARRHFARLAENASRRAGERGFGIWHDGRLAGYIDFDPDLEGLPREGDINVAYAVHPWARRKGIATLAMRLMCAHLAAEGIGSRAILRIEPANAASIGVAERSGFHLLTEDTSTTDVHSGGSASAYAVYALGLEC